MLLVAQTQIAPDSGSPDYVVAAVVASGLLVLIYLVIVAFRVRDSANRLDALEARLDGGAPDGARPSGDAVPAAGLGDPDAVAAEAERLGAER